MGASIRLQFISVVTLTGRLVDRDTKEPISGAEVRVTSRAGSDFSVTRTNLAGEFTFQVPPGAIVLRATHAAARAWRVELARIIVDNATGTANLGELEVEPLGVDVD